MKKSLAVLTFFIATLFGSCAGGDKVDVVTITTPYGEMVVVLFDETPKHKENFLKLVNAKFYDSLLFHRIDQGFMIQGGDPDSRNAAPEAQLGRGGPGYTVPAEFNPSFFHEKGALAAARLGDGQNPQKESSGSQFYIVHGTVYPEEQMQQFKVNSAKMQQAFQQMYQSGAHKPLFDSLAVIYQSGDMAAYQERITALIPRVEKTTGIKVANNITAEQIKTYGTIGGAPNLDGEYTVFGKVVKGLDVIDQIAGLETNYGERPAKDVWMAMKAAKMTKKKIENDYGYKYPAVAPAPKKG